jgi:hypothetical protein
MYANRLSDSHKGSLFSYSCYHIGCSDCVSRKVVSLVVKADCVLRFNKFYSATVMQMKFHAAFENEPSA